jgi:hypothetical protein
LTRHELHQLVAIWRDLKRGGEDSAALDRLQMLIANAAIDVVVEDMVNTSLETSREDNDGHKRPL